MKQELIGLDLNHQHVVVFEKGHDPFNKGGQKALSVLMPRSIESGHATMFNEGLKNFTHLGLRQHRYAMHLRIDAFRPQTKFGIHF
jgi:hypothetical protein